VENVENISWSMSDRNYIPPEQKKIKLRNNEKPQMGRLMEPARLGLF